VETAIYASLKEALEAERPVALATIVDGPDVGRQVVFGVEGAQTGTLGSKALDEAALARAMELLPTFQCEKLALSDGRVRMDVFVEWHGPRPKLVIVGAVHVAIPLVHLARLFGYRTIVVDPRSAFATRERFPHADEVLAEWPDEAFARTPLDRATAVVVLSHDLKIDVPALVLALQSSASYVGALGSKKTQSKRVAALETAGVGTFDISRIHSPIGLNLGGRRAEEIALSIMAEIVAASHGIGSRAATAQPDETSKPVPGSLTPRTVP
jgi:xanthine dehydrogenase accessory factor